MKLFINLAGLAPGYGLSFRETGQVQLMPLVQLDHQDAEFLAQTTFLSFQRLITLANTACRTEKAHYAYIKLESLQQYASRWPTFMIIWPHGEIESLPSEASKDAVNWLNDRKFVGAEIFDLTFAIIPMMEAIARE